MFKAMKGINKERFISEKQHLKVANLKKSTSTCDRAHCQNNTPVQNRPILSPKWITLQTKMFKDRKDSPRHQDLRGQYSRE